MQALVQKECATTPNFSQTHNSILKFGYFYSRPLEACISVSNNTPLKPLDKYANRKNIKTLKMHPGEEDLFISVQLVSFW